MDTSQVRTYISCQSMVSPNFLPGAYPIIGGMSKAERFHHSPLFIIIRDRLANVRCLLRRDDRHGSTAFCLQSRIVPMKRCGYSPWSPGGCLPWFGLFVLSDFPLSSLELLL